MKKRSNFTEIPREPRKGLGHINLNFQTDEKIRKEFKHMKKTYKITTQQKPTILTCDDYEKKVIGNNEGEIIKFRDDNKIIDVIDITGDPYFTLHEQINDDWVLIDSHKC